MRRFRSYNLLLTVLGVFLTVFLASYVFAAGANKIAVMAASGDVKAMSQGSSEWKKVNFGTMLNSGDTVVTGADSYADLSFNGSSEDALVRVDPNTTMMIGAYETGQNLAAKKIALDLAMGDILVKANRLKNESQFQVRTPTSVVGVRGTGFKVQVSAEK